MLTAPADDEPAARRRRLIGALALVAVLAALGGTVAYQVWFAQRPVKPISRTPFHFIVAWRCLECDHRWDDRADVGPHDCPKCGKPQAYVNIRHACGRHGAVDVLFQYAADGKPKEVRVGKGEWMPPYGDDGNWNTVCPTCGEYMMPAEAPRPAP